MKTPTNRIKNYEYRSEKSNLHVNYQIEIIRIVYTDEQENNQISDELRFRVTTEEHPITYEQGLFFAYSVSPVYIQYMIQKKSILKLIQRLLIVIGGIYSVFGIFDSVVHLVALKILKKPYKEIF